ncbi:MAG: class I SAM-dependent methyltransferase [Salinibacterium sp.]|nr:class I SAM-dependent methyltransferase [Salinibacterium sp.]
MDSAELRELLSAGGLALLDSLPRYESSSDVVRSVADLRRAGHSPALVAAVLSQSRLRSRATAKFGAFAERMLFTEAGLEQATRLSVAAQHADRFRRAGIAQVADLGCGIGADALALAALEIEVTAVERDEVTAAIAAYNLAPWPNAHVEHSDAESFPLSGFGGVYLDPARRDTKRKLRNPGDWSPTLDFAFDVASRHPTGIKLSPSVDRSLIPEDAEAQWVSHAGDVVELGLWFGGLAREGVRRSALVLTAEGSAELSAGADSDDEQSGALGEYLYEPNGAVIRARLIGDLARRLNARMLDPSIAYLTADAPSSSPFASCFRIIERMPLNTKTIARALKARGIGTLEIKKRGVDIDPAEFRTSLGLRGEGSATLILTRIAGARAALIAERVG